MSDGINYGDKAIFTDGFKVSLRVAEKDKFVTVGFETRYGKAEFIFFPEEVRVLCDVLERSIEGVELREDLIPESRREI